MRSLLIVLCVLMMAPFASQAQQSTATPLPGTETQRAQQIVSWLAVRPELAYAQFSDELKTAIPQAQIARFWNRSVGQYGEYQHIFGVQADADNHVVTETLLFTNGLVDVQVTFDLTTGQVTGIHFAPSTNPAALATLTPGSNPSTITETEVQAQQSTETPQAGSEVDRAQQLIQMLASGDTADVYVQFSDQVKAAVSEAQLGQAWQGIVGQFGAFQQITDVQSDAANHLVSLTLQFANGLLDAHIVFDATTGDVIGFRFVPSASGTPAPTVEAPTPTYADPSAFTETDVQVGEYNLPGKITLPNGEGPFPAVVLISGSGPSDMDETIGPNKPFRDLAWGLAAQGIATLRFDKRTHAAASAIDIRTLTVKEEYVDDSVAAIELLRQTDGIDPARVFALGHSEGGMVLPRIAEAAPDLAGLIFAEAPALSLPQEALRQLEYIASLTPAGATPDPAIAQMEAEIQQIDSLTADSPSDVMVFGAPPSYWLDLKDYDPVALAASLPQPILLLQGGRDYQVTVADDLPLWQAGLADHPDTTFKVYPDLNHIFVTGTGMATPSEYAQPGNVALEVIDDIAAWVKAH